MAQIKSNDDRFLAEIPWIERPIGDKRMEDTNFYKQIGEKCPLDEKIKRLQLFWMLNESFPFYLPQRYHSMDCLALHKNSKDGNYWANASVFLFNSTAFGHKFLADVHAFLQFGEPALKTLSQSIALYKTIKQKYLKDNLEECRSAAEFLLDPWVLLQLPFQPMLMYQWTVALLAEAFNFDKEIQNIIYLTHQKQLTVPIKKMLDMYIKIIRFVDSQLELFFVYTKNGRGNSYQSFLHSHINCYKNYLFKRYPEILPIIEFVLSQKCKDVINSLRRLAVRSWANDRDRCVIELDAASFTACPFSMYQLFWNCKDKLVDLWPLGQEFCNSDETQNSPAQLTALFEEAMLKSGKLKEEDRGHFITDMESVPHLGELLSLKALLHEHTGVKKAGIIYNVISLQMEATKTGLSTKLLNLESDNESYKYGPVEVVDRCQEAKYNLRQISDILSQVQADKKWCYQNIVNGVKDNFNEKLMEVPGNNAEEIANHFQERIRRIVLKMIERQFDSFKEKNFMHYPECQFVQLILPCFVASLLDLEKDPLAEDFSKNDYFHFIHGLIKSYETTEYSNKIESPQSVVPFACAVGIGIGTPYLEHRWKYADDVLRCILRKGKIFDDFVSKGVSSKFFFDSKAESFRNEMHWTHLVFMFSSRMSTVLRKIGFTSFPELNLYESEYFTQPSTMEEICKEQRWILKTRIWVKYLSKFSESNIEEKQKLLNDGVPPEMIQHAQAISESNLDGLNLYFRVKYFGHLQYIDNFLTLRPGFPLDPVVSACWFLYTKDVWKFKLQLANIFTLRDGNEDPTLIPFKIAESNMCYQSTLNLINTEGKVEMSRPGEITFFPVKHCRWCGQAKVKEFRVCPVCSETPDYPDLNFFCSEKCEKEALEKQHEEEHISFLMEQCGIDK